MHRIALQVGPITITAYALMLASAFLIGTLLAVQRARRWGAAPADVVGVANVIIASSFVGARLLYVAEHWKAFSHDPVSVLYVWQGGFSYHGALVCAVVATLVWVRGGAVPARQMLDLLAPSVALGFVLVRIGCFLNGCCYGSPTRMPWGVVFPLDSPAGAVYANLRIHPTQLYESLSAAVAFALLLDAEKRWHAGLRPGALFVLLLALSAGWRFVVEFFRSHDSHCAVGPCFTGAQVYCTAVVLVSVVMFARRGREGA